ncbi:MAG: alpha/beta fold hydrolase [Solirubrobacterales bacterium]
MERQRHEVTTEDGRRLAVEISGPAKGDVVFFHTGTPSAGLLFGDLIETGAERGLRHISYARPGYGDSDRQEGRTVADCARDVTAILDSVDVGRFYVTGQSGGGPHSLACAALLSDRVIAAAATACPAPLNAEGLDWAAGMGEENAEEFEAMKAGDPELQAYIEGEAEKLATVTPERILAALGDLVSEADRPIVTGRFAEFMAPHIRESLRTGIWGWFDDDKSAGGWGFDLGAIEVPVTIWQGGDDRMVPFGHGKWLAEHVAGAKPRLLPREGHLSLLIGAYGEVLDDLLASRD